MGPLLAAAAIPAGLNFLGGIFGGAAQGKIEKAKLAEQQREFNLPMEYQLSRYQMAGPMRDRASQLLMQRMGGSMPVGSMNQNPTVNSIMGALQPQSPGSLFQSLIEKAKQQKMLQQGQGPNRMPYYGPMGAGAAYGAPGGSGY